MTYDRAALIAATEARVAALTYYLETFSGFTRTPGERKTPDGRTAMYFYRLRSLRAAVRADGSMKLTDNAPGNRWDVEMDEYVPEELVKLTIDWAVKHSTEIGVDRQRQSVEDDVAMHGTMRAVKARNLQPGMVCLFPMGKSLTVDRVACGRKVATIHWREPHCMPTRTELDHEYSVQRGASNA